MKHRWSKFLLSVGALGLIVLHLIWPDLKIDTITLGLAILAALPWLAEFLQKAELPGGWKFEFQALKEEQAKNQDEIRVLQFLIVHFLSTHEFSHLCQLATNEPFPFTKDDTTKFFIDELRHMRSLGLITGQSDKGVRSLLNEGGDVKDHFVITDTGQEYLKLREQFEMQQAALTPRSRRLARVTFRRVYPHHDS